MEQVIRLTVFLNDTLAVHQTEPAALSLALSLPYLIWSKYLFITDKADIILTKAYTRIRDRYLYIITALLRLNRNLAARRSELTGIIRQSIDHKQGEYTVCTHYGISFSHIQLHTFLHETAAAAAYNIKQTLQLKALNIQSNHALTYADPLR